MLNYRLFVFYLFQVSVDLLQWTKGLCHYLYFNGVTVARAFCVTKTSKRATKVKVASYKRYHFSAVRTVPEWSQ